MEDALGESLRSAVSPLRFVVRNFTDTLSGQSFGEEEEILLHIPAVGRYPMAHDMPDSFEVHRATSRRHLAFGQGIHFCPGALLARKEVDSQWLATFPVPPYGAREATAAGALLHRERLLRDSGAPSVTSASQAHGGAAKSFGTPVVHQESHAVERCGCQSAAEGCGATLLRYSAAQGERSSNSRPRSALISRLAKVHSVAMPETKTVLISAIFAGRES